MILQHISFTLSTREASFRLNADSLAGGFGNSSAHLGGQRRKSRNFRESSTIPGGRVTERSYMFLFFLPD